MTTLHQPNGHSALTGNAHDITEDEAQAYRRLAARAKQIERDLSQLAVSTVAEEIPDDVKARILDWVDRAETFRGLSYFLTPQTQWTGGDSQDAKNFKVTAPHIARPR